MNTIFVIAKTYLTAQAKLAPVGSRVWGLLANTVANMQAGVLTGDRHNEWLITPVDGTDLAVVSSIHDNGVKGAVIVHEVMAADVARLWVNGRKVVVNPATGGVEVTTPDMALAAV